MSRIQIHSKYGKITAQPMDCVDIKNSIPETEQEVQSEVQGTAGDEVQAPAEDSVVDP